MDPVSRIDTAGRQIAGLLGYNPGPGIYSRLERAVEAMPANVRVQELPGLLKRYKEGVPGWELKATDLDSTIAGRDVVPRDELLAAVRERSPVHTHHEMVLGGPKLNVDRHGNSAEELLGPGRSWEPQYPPFQEWTDSIVRSSDAVHGKPRYENFGQGGKDYTEILLLQPEAPRGNFDSHWDNPNAVAHARFDTQGDALRINELQSDLGIHNRKARQALKASEGRPPQGPREGDFEYAERLESQGYKVDYDDEGDPIVASADRSMPFPLEGEWADLLIKRMAIEAARKGHRAIEVASPQAVFDKTGNHLKGAESLSKMQHFYGNVVPGALESLGRRMGGLEPVTDLPDAPTINTAEAISSAANDAKKSAADAIWRMRRQAPGMGPDLLTDEYEDIANKMHLLLREGHSPDSLDRILSEHYDSAYRAAVQSLTQGNMQIGPARKAAGIAIGDLIERAKAQAALTHSRAAQGASAGTPPGWRGIMSDEMRRRLIEAGVGASVLAPLLMQGEE